MTIKIPRMYNLHPEKSFLLVITIMIEAFHFSCFIFGMALVLRYLMQSTFPLSLLIIGRLATLIMFVQEYILE